MAASTDDLSCLWPLPDVWTAGLMPRTDQLLGERLILVMTAIVFLLLWSLLSPSSCQLPRTPEPPTPRPIAAQPNVDQAKAELAFGIEMAQRGLWHEAFWRFRRAVQLDPENAKAWLALGITFERYGLIARAHTAYNIALALDPDDLVIRGTLEAFRRDHPDSVPARVSASGSDRDSA